MFNFDEECMEEEEFSCKDNNDEDDSLHAASDCEFVPLDNKVKVCVCFYFKS